MKSLISVGGDAFKHIRGEIDIYIRLKFYLSGQDLDYILVATFFADNFFMTSLVNIFFANQSTYLIPGTP